MKHPFVCRGLYQQFEDQFCYIPNIPEYSPAFVLATKLSPKRNTINNYRFCPRCTVTDKHTTFQELP